MPTHLRRRLTATLLILATSSASVLAQAQSHTPATQAEPAPEAAPAPQRELVYVIIGREPNGEPDQMLRALQAILGDTAPTTLAPTATAPTATVTTSTSATPTSTSAVPTPEQTDSDAASEAIVEHATDALDVSVDATLASDQDALPPAHRDELGVLTWSLLGLGGAALLGGAITGGLVLESRSELDAMCPAGMCPAGSADALSRTGTLADVSTALFIGGGAGVAAGLIALLVSDLTSGPSDAPTVSASADGTSAMVFLNGSF